MQQETASAIEEACWIKSYTGSYHASSSMVSRTTHVREKEMDKCGSSGQAVAQVGEQRLNHRCIWSMGVANRERGGAPTTTNKLQADSHADIA